MKRLLITGFDTHPSLAVNPSAELVRSLKKKLSKDKKYKIKYALLKTAYRADLKRLQKEISSFKPDVVVSFGVAPSAKEIRLEQAAQNKYHLNAPDVSGFLPDRQNILQQGPDSYVSSLNLDKIKSILDKNNINSSLSNDAGTYVCNFIFYHLMRIAGDTNNLSKAGFIHIPIPDQADTLSSEDLLSAAYLIIENA